MLRPVAAFLCLWYMLGAVCALAARPLPDLHKWDSYFALFARNSSVPWKETTVRLDTYSSAPVDFSAYAADPADIVVAGTGARPRVLATEHLHAAARWRFTPSGGYRFESSMVPVPLGSREGFFVVQARRGNVVQQVWINRTRIGILTKQSAGEILLYGTDLGSGRALSKMRVSFLAGGRFFVRYTDAHGLAAWQQSPRPIFALADYGSSKAFVSFLPQAPLPNALAGIVVDSPVVRAGERLRVAGFARTRTGAVFKPARDRAEVSIRSGASLLVRQSAALDSAGAFVTELMIPQSSPAGDYTVLVTAANTSAGAAVHIDANADGMNLKVMPRSNADGVTLDVLASRAGLPVAGAPVRVTVVRSPHIAPSSATSFWGISKVLDLSVSTGAAGTASVTVDHPTDGLASTYGIVVSSGGATATTRLVVPTSEIALRIELNRTEQSLGIPVTFDIYANAVADGKPVPDLPVTMQLVHGPSIQEQTLTLDGNGHGRGAFTNAELGSNLILARASAGGKEALDAQEVRVVPGALSVAGANRSAGVSLALDRPGYRVADRIAVSSYAAGAAGDALITYETATQIDASVVPVRDGRATTTFTARNAAGSVEIGTALVRDGELRWSSIPVALAGPGRAQTSSIHLDGDVFSAGGTAHLKIDEGKSADRTIIVRMSSSAPTGSARFDGAPDLLSIGQAASQDSAPPDGDWHAGVDAAATHASTLSFEANQSARPEDLTLAQAESADLYWRVLRSGTDVNIPLPQAPGIYTLSILELGDDGHVAAGSQSVTIR